MPQSAPISAALRMRTLAADDRGDRDDMVGVGGVAHAEKESDRKQGKRGDQGKGNRLMNVLVLWARETTPARMSAASSAVMKIMKRICGFCAGRGAQRIITGQWRPTCPIARKLAGDPDMTSGHPDPSARRAHCFSPRRLSQAPPTWAGDLTPIGRGRLECANAPRTCWNAPASAARPRKSRATPR